MKHFRLLLAMTLILGLTAGLAACGSSSAPETKAPAETTAAAAPETQSPETQAPETAAPETEAPETTAPEAPSPEPVTMENLAGDYSAFAAEIEGSLADSKEIGLTSELTLRADGTGHMTFNDDASDITSWVLAGDTATITMADESTADAAVQENGVLIMDIMGDGSVNLYFAKPGTDISAYTLLTQEDLLKQREEEEANKPKPDTRLYALYESIDTEQGAHLNYDLHLDYLNSDCFYDVHNKGGTYYSSRTVKVSGTESTTVTVVKENKVYNLYPEDMHGLLVTEIGEALSAQNILNMDSLYSDIYTRAFDTEYTEETREIEGTTYTAEVFPEGEYTAEIAFCFNEDGSLAYVEKGPLPNTTIDIGNSFYKIHSIDSAVDESLLDISAYTIEE